MTTTRPILCGFLLVAVGANSFAAATLTVTPSRGLVDEPIAVRVTGARPGTAIRLQAELVDDDGRTWTSVGEYVADASGVVDTRTAQSAGGTYRGASPGGLSCSVLPVPRDELPAYVEKLREKPDRTTPSIGDKDSFTMRVSAQAGTRTLGPITVMREYRASGVVAQEVDAGRVQGRYFEPAAGPRGVPVVVLGGSGGGLQHASAALLASHGHPSLAVAYFGYKNLPTSLAEIPLEGFGEAAAWLKEKTGAPGVVLMGTSRGSEAVMLTAAYLPANIAGVIALAPSPVVNGAFGRDVPPARGIAPWTLGGRGIAPVRPSASAETDGSTERRQRRAEDSKGPPGYAGTPYFLADWSDPAAQLLFGIPVERIAVPVLLLGGEADTMWPSAFAVHQIRERMAAHGKGDLVTAHTFPGAGHGIARIGVGNEMSGFNVHPVSKSWVSTGGEPDANCRATYDTWAHILSFIERQVPAHASQ